MAVNGDNDGRKKLAVEELVNSGADLDLSTILFLAELNLSQQQHQQSVLFDENKDKNNNMFSDYSNASLSCYPDNQLMQPDYQQQLNNYHQNATSSDQYASNQLWQQQFEQMLHWQQQQQLVTQQFLQQQQLKQQQLMAQHLQKQRLQMMQQQQKQQSDGNDKAVYKDIDNNDKSNQKCERFEELTEKLSKVELNNVDTSTTNPVSSSQEGIKETSETTSRTDNDDASDNTVDNSDDPKAITTNKSLISNTPNTSTTHTTTSNTSTTSSSIPIFTTSATPSTSTTPTTCSSVVSSPSKDTPSPSNETKTVVNNKSIITASPTKHTNGNESNKKKCSELDYSSDINDADKGKESNRSSESSTTPSDHSHPTPSKPTSGRIFVRGLKYINVKQNI